MSHPSTAHRPPPATTTTPPAPHNHWIWLTDWLTESVHLRITGVPLVSSPGNSQNEIQRQNRITQRIIANFLERRLFPFRRPQNDVPTIDEILPAPTKDPPRSKYGEIGGGGGRARKRFRPKSTIDLLQGGGGGGKKSGFRPSHPKYSASRNNSEQSSGSDDQDRVPDEDYYDDAAAAAGEEDYGDVENQEEVNYDNYDEDSSEGRSSSREGEGGDNNSTTEMLAGDGGLLGAFSSLGDYDDAESLQTVESEHFNLFYRNHNKRFNGHNNNRFYLDDDLYEGRCCIQ